MRTFLKANMASLIATSCDYGLTVVLKEFIKVNEFAAGVSGTVLGGIVNFLISRHWVFKAGDEQAYSQGKRFFIIWTGNLVLNATGYYILVHYTNIHYVIAKLITSLTVMFAYNYPLQKNYVFKNR
ncbi:MAG: GtrA family protein [Bacteroidota bacterium]